MTQQINVATAKVDGLLFTRMQVSERLGELFAYEVEFESQDIAIDLSGLLKSPMAIKLETRDGYERYFHGMVCEAEQTSVEKVDNLVYAKYRARLVPRPWLLTGVVDCRIFKNLAVPDIVKTILSDAGYTDLTLNLSATYTAREYCVQYREDGWNFIQRLLQQEGIYYYFTHTSSKHTLVLADGVGSHAQAQDFGKVPYQPGGPGVLSAQSTIWDWALLRGVDGASVQLTDYNPLQPKASLLVSADSVGHQADGLTVFDYPGTHAETTPGKHYAQVRAEAMSAARSRYVGRTGACSIEIGGLFTLSDHPRKPLNCEYLVTATSMELSAPGYASGAGDADGPTFQCTFEALESSQPWRSPQTARKPTVPGLQTAIVTGSETDEDIAVDQHGRVQVNFHWNMPGKQKADCSCPVRVASMWAGKAWGAVSYPRVGQEVVVSFIEGDPDRPLIIGSVYNAVNTPPYTLPDNKTQSGIKSRSLLGVADDFNELRLEDKKGEEDFFIHAQKDMHEEVENDHTVTIDHDEIITVKNDQTGTIKHDRTHTITNDDKLTVNNNGTTDIAHAFKLTAGDQIELICGQASITLKASGEIDIAGTTIKVTGQNKVTIKGAMGVDISGMSINAKADLEAKLAGTMTTVQGDATVTVKGGIASLQGEGMAKVAGAIVMLG